MEAVAVSSAEICCDACGYLRQGLVEESRCPECGADAPQLVDLGLGDRLDARGVLERVLVTRGRLTWLRVNALGLLLLLYTTYCAMRVTLIMALGQLSLPAVNFAGPKLSLMALLQRSLGGPPGAWGVEGTIAVLGGVASVWLLTRRQNHSDHAEAFFSIRRAVRWASVLMVGGMFGLLVSGAHLYESRRYASDQWLLAALMGELIANTLLYIHLLRTATAVGDQRAIACLRVARWMVPGLIVGGILLGAFLTRVIGLPEWEKDPRAVRKIVLMLMPAYGAIALAGGAIATAGVASLLVSISHQAFGGAGFMARGVIGGGLGWLQKCFEQFRSAPARWMFVAGIGLWLWLLPSMVQQAMNYPEQGGMAGRLPMLSFPGPRVELSPIVSSLIIYGSAQATQVPTLMWEFLALWMITAPGLAGLGSRARRVQLVSRWFPVILAGAAVGAGMSMRSNPQIASLRMIPVAINLVEVPVTVLIYLHLANVALVGGSGALAKRLRILAGAVGVVALLPLAGFGMLKYTQPFHYSPGMGWLCAAYGAVSLGVACLAVVAMVQVGWVMVWRREEVGAAQRFDRIGRV